MINIDLDNISAEDILPSSLRVYCVNEEMKMRRKKTMFCSKCGSELIEGAVFCPKCGTKVVYSDVVQQPMDIPIPDTKGQQDSKAVKDPQKSLDNNTAKVNGILHKAADFAPILVWVSLLLLLPFWPLRISPAILVAGVAIGIILSIVQRFGNLQHQGILNKALRRIIRDCNDRQLLKGKNNPVLLPNFSCYSLRHAFTTRLVEAGVNIKVIQELCGHSRSDVTLDIYTTVTKELKQREFGNFEEKLKQQKEEWMRNGDTEKEGK